MQGVPWWKRKAIGLATLTLAIKHYKDDAGIEHIDIDQTLTGGIPGTTEIRILTWTERPNEDHVFGPVIGKSRRIKVDSEELEDPFLKEHWTNDTITHGLVQSYAKSNTPKSGTTWTADQVHFTDFIVMPLLSSVSSQDLGDFRSDRWQAEICEACQVHRAWRRGYQGPPRLRLLWVFTLLQWQGLIILQMDHVKDITDIDVLCSSHMSLLVNLQH